MTKLRETQTTPVLGAKIASTMRLVYSTLVKLKKASRLAGPIDEILGALNPVVRRLCTAGCFAAGTLVATSSGLQAIEQIKPGMEVWAWDAKANTARLCKVEETFSNAPLPVWRMDYDLDGDRTSDGHLVATKEHPIWADNAERYIPISELREGECLRQLENDRYAEVISIQREAENQVTWNMRVADLHNYFAGDDAILVHNAFCRGNERWTDALTEKIQKARSGFVAGRSVPTSPAEVWDGWTLFDDALRRSGKPKYDQDAKLAVYSDLLDEYKAMGGSPLDLPHQIPNTDPRVGPKEQEWDRFLSGHLNNQDSTKGWIYPNPLENLQDKSGNKFGSFDRDIDGVPSEYFNPDLLKNGLNGIEATSVTKLVEKIEI